MDVLLVEDEPLVRAAAADALRDAGLVVAEAACAEQALAMGSAAKEPPAVVVADLRLGPGMDGLALGAVATRKMAEAAMVGTAKRFNGAPPALARQRARCAPAVA